MFDNMTLKIKLITLAALISFGFGAVLFMENRAIGELQIIAKMDHATEELNVEMLTLRKHEKDFLARKDTKYLSSFQKIIKRVDATTEELEEELQHFDADTKPIIEFKKIIHEYAGFFQKVVQMQQSIGLSAKEGLYGELRSKVHEVQDFSKKANDAVLLSQVYDLRKQEKDFMLRLDKKYVNSFNTKLDKLTSNDTYSSMHSLLNQYKTSFNKLVDLEEKRGLTSKDGLMGKMRKTIQSSTKSLGVLTKQILHLEESKRTEIIQVSIVLTLAIAIFTILVLLYISRSITLSLRAFEKGLIGFFAFINNETKEVTLLNDKNSDEIGTMAKIINQSIENTKANIEKDRALIDDATNVANKIKVGYLNNRITQESSTEELNDLKNVINEMLKNLNTNIDNILTVLASYSEYNFLPKVSTSNVEGDVLELCKGINFLGDSTTKMLLSNKGIGLGLTKSADILVNNVENLNTNANSTAASIEETAAALEEITATVVSNNESIQQMSVYAQEVTAAVQKGEELANQTTKAMDELNGQVTSINDSIGLIDQIAFQTNILSLNAAVEAATAGEAGKGFAVVAQEVRNLASRSAEVAKEIKDLVENATNKAGDGKQIADNMISGYSSLNDNIQKTITIINDVSAASKEQQAGIEQINDAVTQVDQQTQQIAMIAGQTQEIAEQTNVIANDIVKDADKKEFEGKNSVKAIETKASVHNKESIPNHQTNEIKPKKIIAKSVDEKKEIIKTKNTEPQKVAKKPIKNEAKKVKDKSSDDEWESF